MKKLFTLLSLMALICVSANVWAQYSTGVAPYPGATHTYSVSSTADSWVWEVYKGSYAPTNKINTASLPSNGVDSFTATNGQVVIKWSSTAAVDDEYLVVVTETVGSCVNSKALPVKITASQFDLVVTAGSDACYGGPVDITWAGGTAATNVVYDHGEATITYSIQATGLGTSETWSFEPEMSYVTAGTYTQTFTVTPTSGSVTENSGVFTVTGPQTVTLTVVVDNQNTFNNSSAANAQNYTATMTLKNIASGTGAIEKDNTNNAGNVAVSRPNTTQISYN